MEIKAFLCRSFGILSLLLSVMAFFSCNGPWLKTLPEGTVGIPLGIGIFLVWLGIYLLRLPIQRTGKLTSGSFLVMKLMIGAAAFGGVILTSYFHGETQADVSGLYVLRKIAFEYFLILPVLVGVGWLIRRLLQRKSKLASEPTHQLPITRIG